MTSRRPFMPRARLVAVIVLLTLTAALLMAEWAGWPIRFHVRMSNDVRRESYVFAQYGQFAWGLVVALTIWHLDPARRRMIVPLLITVGLTALVATGLKHAVGRARPAVGQATEIDGPAMSGSGSGYASFPSGHSATAVALTVVLASLYPRGRAMFWGMALTCAGLRFLTNAHWASDVVAGIALGYIMGTTIWHVLVERHAGTRGGIMPAAAPRTIVPIPQN